jgi:Mg-chelatase subunit ChlD
VVDTTFLRVLGIQNMTVGSQVEVTRQTQLLDVVLSFDMSESMTSQAGNGQTRIQAARNAANSLVGILFGDDSTKDLLKIGLVPWNSKVNVTYNTGNAYDPHPAFNKNLTRPESVGPYSNPYAYSPTPDQVFYANNSPVPLIKPPPDNWKGCVYNRYVKGANTADDADIYEAGHSGGGVDWPGWEPVGDEGEPISKSQTRCIQNPAGAPRNSSCTPCFNHGITQLNSSKDIITAAINQLTTPSGNTNAPAGLAWAWRVLTPATPWTEADPNPLYRRQQAIVLLTDGQNVGGIGDGYKATFGTDDAARAAMDARTRLLAQNIKAAGVIIYVIQFANNNSTMQTLLKEVASSPDAPFYNYAPTGAALQQIFREVANNLSELRLSK